MSGLALLRVHPESFQPISIFKLLRITAVSPGEFSLLRVVLVLALLLAAFGALTRLSLTLACGASFLYFGTLHCLFDGSTPVFNPQPYDAVLFFLIILTVSPGVGLWGVDGLIRRKKWEIQNRLNAVVPAWPAIAVKMMLALIYFGAAYGKWRMSGFRWADGGTIQAVFLQHSMMTDPHFGIEFWLAGHPGICLAMGATTLVFESTFWLVLLPGSIAWFYVAIGLLMHVVCQFTMNVNFVRYFTYPYLIFLTWPLLLKMIPLPATQLEGRAICRTLENFSPSRPSRFPVFFVSALAVINLTCAVGSLYAWPFSPWRFYSLRYDYSTAVIYRVRGSAADGRARWLTRSELGREPGDLSAGLRDAIESGDHAWIDRTLFLISEGLPPGMKKEFSEIVVMRRRVRLDASGAFRFEDEAVARAPIVSKAVTDGHPSQAPTKNLLPE